MSSSRHLSSLKRGLSALSILNVCGRLSASELAKRIKVPRTTAHRILNTLMAEGYVVRDPHSHGYQLTVQVRRLAFGFSRDGLIAEVARPILRDLCKEVLTPVGLATPVGCELVIQVSMDYESPLALERLPEGTSFPLTYGPSGHLFLAHCGPELRREMIEGASHSPSARRMEILNGPSAADLEQILADQYALSVRHDPQSHEGVIAVPVYLSGAYVASVHLRYMKRVFSPAAALDRFLAKLQAAAVLIERGVEERISEAHGLVEGLNRPLNLSADTSGDTTH